MLSKEEALARIAQKAGYQSLRRYQARAQFLFQGVDLNGQRVLDVGCGEGAFALWAAIHGAAHVLGIEPEGDGSTGDSLGTFRGLIQELDLDEAVEASSQTLQELPEQPVYRVIVLYNVINHLHESAVQRLHQDPQAARLYLSLLCRLRGLLEQDGLLIVADCGRNNFWNAIGLRSPVTPTIEWNKHQEPETWINLLSQAGFRLQDLRWSPLYPFGNLSANRWVHYFSTSHFVLRFLAN